MHTGHTTKCSNPILVKKNEFLLIHMRTGQIDGIYFTQALAEGIFARRYAEDDQWILVEVIRSGKSYEIPDHLFWVK